MTHNIHQIKEKKSLKFIKIKRLKDFYITLAPKNGVAKRGEREIFKKRILALPLDFLLMWILMTQMLLHHHPLKEIESPIKLCELHLNFIIPEIFMKCYINLFSLYG